MSKRLEDAMAYLIAAAIIAFCVGFGFLVHHESKECKARGGILVRTAFGGECIKATTI